MPRKTAKPKATTPRTAGPRPAVATKGKATTAGERTRSTARPDTAASKRTAARWDARPLKRGELDGLVLAYLKKEARGAPHGPSGIGRALGRSSGAVANCLVRLVREERVIEVSESPRRYRLPA